MYSPEIAISVSSAFGTVFSIRLFDGPSRHFSCLSFAKSVCANLNIDFRAWEVLAGVFITALVIHHDPDERARVDLFPNHRDRFRAGRRSAIGRAGSCVAQRSATTTTTNTSSTYMHRPAPAGRISRTARMTPGSCGPGLESRSARGGWRTTERSSRTTGARSEDDRAESTRSLRSSPCGRTVLERSLRSAIGMLEIRRALREGTATV